MDTCHQHDQIFSWYLQPQGCWEWYPDLLLHFLRQSQASYKGWSFILKGWSEISWVIFCIWKNTCTAAWSHPAIVLLNYLLCISARLMFRIGSPFLDECDSTCTSLKADCAAQCPANDIMMERHRTLWRMSQKTNHCLAHFCILINLHTIEVYSVVSWEIKPLNLFFSQ